MILSQIQITKIDLYRASIYVKEFKSYCSPVHLPQIKHKLALIVYQCLKDAGHSGGVPRYDDSERVKNGLVQNISLDGALVVQRFQ